jgi:segregation and condensation protein A
MIDTLEAFDVVYNPINQQDLKALADSLNIAVTNEWVSNETASIQMGFDYAVEQMLLPKENQEEEDPRKPLVAKLLEYEQFKKASVQLDSRSWLGRDIFCRTEISVDDILPEETKLDAPIEAVDNFQLLLCLKIALDRSFRKPIEISADMTSIKEKVTHITGLLETSTSLNFAELMSPTPRINEVIVSFLAILELAKLKFIEIIQLENFGIIQIRPVRELREINYGLLDQY